MPVSTDPILDPQAVLDAVVLRSDGLVVPRREVLRWAARFAPSIAARADRRAALAALALDDETIDAEVENAAAEFRYERELESSDALTAWLAARGLSVDAWWEAVRRGVLERRFDGLPVPSGDAPGPDDADPGDAGTLEEKADEEDADARIAELVVTDLLEPAVQALARRIAVARAAEVSLPEAGGLPHDELEAAWRRWRTEACAEAQLQVAVDRERLAWLVLDLTRSRWPTLDAAREAVSCVRHDGSPLEEVARDAGAPAAASRCLLANVPEVLHDALLTAASGELVGPVELPTHWEVVLVRAKRTPSLSDPLVRAAAEREVEARAAAPLVLQHVQWPGATA